MRHPNVVQTYKYVTHHAEVTLLATPYQGLDILTYCLMSMRSCSKAESKVERDLKCMCVA